MNVQSRSAYPPLNFGHQSGGAHRHAPHQDHHEHGPHCNHAHAPKEPHVHGPHCNHDHHDHDHHDHGHKPAPSKPPFLSRLKNWLLAIPRFFADALKIFWRDITGKGGASQPHSH